MRKIPKETSCAIISCPPDFFPFNTDIDAEGLRLKLMLYYEINDRIEHGIKCFHVAIDNGFGLYAAETINSMRKLGSEIDLVCYVNIIKNSVLSWSEDLQRRYLNILNDSSAIALCGETPDPNYTDYAAMACAGKASSCAILIVDSCDNFYMEPIVQYLCELNIDGTVYLPK